MSELKAVRMKRWPAATKVLHMCPVCHYVVFKPEPMEPDNCPRCAGLIAPANDHEFNVPEHSRTVLESVINLDSMTDKLEG